MKIHIGTDHAGFELKNKLVAWLESRGHEVVDHGALVYDETDDYPDFIKPVARSVAHDPDSRGIIIGGSGQGEAMCANRYKGARATQYYGGNPDIVKISREHNNANILSLGARFMNAPEAYDAVELFLATEFTFEERHVRRMQKWTEQIID
jgi:ribose 5-phosphate isomerase B